MSMSTSSTSRPDGLLHVGRVGRPHGVRGDTYLDFFTPRPERLAPGSRVWIAGRWHELASVRAQGERFVARFADVEGRDAAEALTNAEVWAEPIDDPSVIWVHEVVGKRVVADGVDRGVCVAVIDNPAHPILELDTGALVPGVFIVSLDGDTVMVEVPDGLFEVEDA
jgi:16S rRNA processing protein RimM